MSNIAAPYPSSRPSGRYAAALRDPQRTITSILEAAERVLIDSGVEKATIEEFAREAGVSKGGVLHHFPGKEAILVALVTKMIVRFETEINEFQSLDPEPRGSFSRAFLRAVCQEKDEHCMRLCTALKAAFQSSPVIAKHICDAHLQWQARIENDGIDPVVASVVRLATDGLWLARMHRVSIPSEEFRPQLIDYLIGMTQPPAGKKIIVTNE